MRKESIKNMFGVSAMLLILLFTLTDLHAMSETSSNTAYNVISETSSDIMLNTMPETSTDIMLNTMPEMPSDTVQETQPETTVPETTEPPLFTPKILIEDYSFSSDKIFSGDEFTVNITLLNTNHKLLVKNMTVTVSADEGFELKSKSDTLFIEQISAGDRYSISYTFSSEKGLAAGQYNFELNMDYADAKGNVYTSNGRFHVNLSQTVRVEFDKLSIGSEAEVGDVLSARINAINLGRSRVYNVRAELSADGLTPEGVIFIGDIEPGMSEEGIIEVDVGGLSKGESKYGTSKGTITYYYENEAGEEFSETTDFHVTINSPFVNYINNTITDSSQRRNDIKQWWIAIAVVGVVMTGSIVYIAVLRKRSKR